MSGECDKCGEHALECRCPPFTFKAIKNSNHPWAQFLYARAVAMNWMRDEMNRSNAEIATELSMDEMQVRLILMEWDGSVTLPSLESCFSKEGYEVMEWIKVEDKLPEDGQDVLVYHADDFHITVGYFESNNVRYYIESDGGKFYTDSGWETEIPWAQKGRVTHWMPLPEPPKIRETSSTVTKIMRWGKDRERLSLVDPQV